jgi:gliding motility-associated-like protein
MQAGNHVVIYSYTDSRNCTNSDTENLMVNALPEATIRGEQNVCPGTIEVPYIADGYQPGYNYSYTVTGGTFRRGDFAATIFVTWGNDPLGKVNLTLTNSQTSCQDTFSYVVNVGDIVNPVLMNCMSEYHLTAMGGEQERYHIFDTADTLYVPKATDNCSLVNLMLTFSPNGGNPVDVSQFVGYRFNGSPINTIQWKVTDASGNSAECISTVYFDFDKVPPSAFSPNGDDVNDVWEIDFLMEYPNAVVKVYNRWGVAVFESEKGYPVKWDGRNKGILVPVDTYYYIITGVDSDKPMRGIISVVY